jgi:DNA mismatch repair protein MutS2
MARNRRFDPIARSPRPVGDREIDLHGMIADDALMRLAEEINSSIRFRERYLRINHGKGTGTLRLAVHDMLAHHPLVVRHFAAPANAGGDGVTVAELAV